MTRRRRQSAAGADAAPEIGPAGEVGCAPGGSCTSDERARSTNDTATASRTAAAKEDRGSVCQPLAAHTPPSVPRPLSVERARGPDPLTTTNTMLTLRSIYDRLRLTAEATQRKAEAYAEQPHAASHGNNSIPISSSSNNHRDYMTTLPAGGNDENVTAGHADSSSSVELNAAYTPSAGATTTPRAYPVSVGDSSEASRTAGAAAPSQSVVLKCAARLNYLVAGSPPRARGGCADQSGSSVSASAQNAAGAMPAAEMTALANHLSWFCLQTAKTSPVLAGIGAVSGGWLGHSSQQASGRVTPGHPSAPPRPDAAGTRRTSAASSVFGDWASSRMAAGSGGSGCSSAAAAPLELSDEQLGQTLLPLAVFTLVRNSSSFPAPSAASAMAGSEGGVGAAAASAAAAAAAVAKQAEELRLSAVVLLCAVLVRFPHTEFNSSAFLPLLFPNTDVRTATPMYAPPGATATGAVQWRGGSGQHPLLSPLLWDGSPTVRSAASVLLAVLLCKMQRSLQFAEEPRRQPQSFVSLTTQGGAALLAIHEGLYWALSCCPPETSARAPAGLPAGICPAAVANKTPLLHVFAAAVAVTPYNRCPRSTETVLRALELPSLRQVLRSAGTGVGAGTDGARGRDEEYVATMSFLTHVFKSESLRTHLAAFLAIRPPDSAAAAASGGGLGLLTEALAHASDRAEVWHCIVHIARLYPTLIQQRFEELMGVSAAFASTLVQQETRITRFDGAAPPAGGPSGAADTSASRGGNSPQKPVDSSSGVFDEVRHPAGALPGESSTPAHADPCAVAPALTEASSSRASPEAFAECLRAWLHFTGYAWKAFDNNPDDPALRAESQHDRATPAQRNAIFSRIIVPATGILRQGEEVRVMTLRCLAQLGEEFVRSSAVVTEPMKARLVAYVRASLEDWNPRVQAEALNTVGVWAWQYPSFDAHGPMFVDVCAAVLSVGTDPSTRTKAAFAICNLTSRLSEPSSVTRGSPAHMALLIETAMEMTADVNVAVQGHAIRMLGNLLQTLEFDELVAELEPNATLTTLHMTSQSLAPAVAVPDAGGAPANGCGLTPPRLDYVQGAEPPVECVVEGFLRVLLFFLSRPQNEPKHRWNAASALGEALRRSVVYEAEPGLCVESVRVLLAAVVRDRIFKVRTQAAIALAKTSAECLAADDGTGTADLTPTVVRVLCAALGSAESTENFAQFKETGALHTALRQSLSVVVATATPSRALDQVFAEYRPLLQKEELLW